MLCKSFKLKYLLLGVSSSCWFSCSCLESWQLGLLAKRKEFTWGNCFHAVTTVCSKNYGVYFTFSLKLYYLRNNLPIQKSEEDNNFFRASVVKRLQREIKKIGEIVSFPRL